MRKRPPLVYVVSDSVGETAELVVRAASSQFEVDHLEIRRVPYVVDRDTVVRTVEAAREEQALIVFTLVIPELQQLLSKKLQKKKYL
jgi:[pyruvate, water dikinase]-phosphate phosphotransferase / [pyruvate, water dikinase] kinase